MLDPKIRDLARDRNFCTISVRLPHGDIATHVMWVDATDDHVLVNTEVHRAKYRAIQADPRVTVMVWRLDDPYVYAEVRGVVDSEVRGVEARAHIDALAQRYSGTDYAGEIRSERVILRIAPTRTLMRGL